MGNSWNQTLSKNSDVGPGSAPVNNATMQMLGIYDTGPETDWMAGAPSYPGFKPIYDPSMRLNTGGDAGFNAFSQSALRGGPSPWAKQADAQSYMQQGLAADTVTKNQASATASGEGALAMRGGLRSGAQERMQTAGGNQLIQSQQQLQNQGLQNRAQIGINDEQNRVAQLGQLMNTETQRGQFNTTAEMQGNQAENQYNMGAYTNQANMFGGSQMAKATEASGKKSGLESASWICSAAARHMGHRYSPDEKRALQSLKRMCRKLDKPAYYFYFHGCQELTLKMERGGAVWAPIFEFVKSVITQVIAGDAIGAFDRYAAFTKEMIDQYWPECTDSVYLEADYV